MGEPVRENGQVVMDDLVFVVEGTAVPKQSFRYASGGGYQPERVKNWQKKVRLAGKQAYGQDPERGPLYVQITFRLPDRRRRDLDNLSKGTLDALTGVIWVDDQQIETLVLKKRYGKGPRAEICVSTRLQEAIHDSQMD